MNLKQESHSGENTSAEEWLALFENHLRSVAGSSEATVRRYRSVLWRFLSERFGCGEVVWASITADCLAEFVIKEALRRKNFGRKVPGTALRAMLRYLVFRGKVRLGLEGAIPAMRQCKHSALPTRLTDQEVAALFAQPAITATGIRDRAVLLLLARLGLRAREIARLSVDDIDWHGGRLILAPGKTHQERVLPMSEEVGSALAAYVITARPTSQSRFLFLRSLPPYEAMEGASAVSRIARRRLLESGYPAGPRIGAHLFRHTLASAMVCHGAAFKDVADVLGHKCLQTTGIYAKLDLVALSKVALPCSGGSI
jgi:integrase/recombinase XerD